MNLENGFSDILIQVEFICDDVEKKMQDDDEYR